MKKIIFIFLLLFPVTLMAGDPHEVVLKTKIIRPVSWYAEEALYWQMEAARTSSPDAWLQYYISSRYSNKSKTDLMDIQTKAETSLTDKTVAKIMRAWNLGYSDDAYQTLREIKQAQEIYPVVAALLTMHYEFRNEPDFRKISSENLLKSGAVAQSLLSYTYNVLMSVETNGIVVTEGDNTTLPMFILQDVYKVRPDVSILNLDLLEIEQYRKSKLERLSLLFGTQNNPSKENICRTLPDANPASKFYFALTVDQQNLSAMKDQLYVVGLASRASKDRIDNISIIRENLENKFLLDYLTVDFNGESQFASGKVLSGNYLVPMLLLTEDYLNKNDVKSFNRWSEIVDKVGNDIGKGVAVRHYLNRPATFKFVPANLDIRRIEGMQRLVKDRIYANEYEVTNAEYNAFLKYLKNTNQTDVLERSKIDLSQYTEPALALMKNYHDDRTPTKKERYFTQYPVINISHEGAIEYCKWLTEQYNNSEGRKFKKVIFRLPKVNEWQMAALGYSKFQSWNISENMIEVQIPKNSTDVWCKNCPVTTVKFSEADIRYPWYKAYNFRNKALNEKGCALGNFKWPDGHKNCNKGPAVDGFVLSSSVGAYFPNNIGLYDVVGNVAEMTNEKGKACGGSWNHFPEQSTITSVNEYSGPDAAVGFRVFMEVIEE